jgi:hypothetical protein
MMEHCLDELETSLWWAGSGIVGQVDQEGKW